MKLLVAVITGNRPALAQRPTRQFFDSLKAAGFADIEWVVRADHAETYERDGQPLNTYSTLYADEYSRTHWQHPTSVWEPGGFHGAAPGREWAMRTAEERGYEAVLQLDDNVTHLGLLNASQPAFRAALDPGKMVQLLAELSASTSAMMLGMQLNSAPPKGKAQVVRTGFPYSVFIEKTGPNRMPYFGPYEDDIMHALEYGLHGGPTCTAGVVELLRYLKEFTSKSGMRSHYDASRGLEIARRYPENVTLRVSRKTSGPRDTGLGVRHFLRSKGFTPIRVTDQPAFLAAEKTLKAAYADAQRLKFEQDRRKMRRRAGLSPVT